MLIFFISEFNKGSRCMNTIENLQRFPVDLTEQVTEVLKQKELVVRERVIRVYQKICPNSPQPPAAKLPKLYKHSEEDTGETCKRVNNEKKTVVQLKNGNCYGFILRHVDLDLHEDSFLMMKLVNLENAKVALEISKGTFNRKMFFKIAETVLFDNVEEGISYYESDKCTKLIKAFHPDHIKLPIVKLCDTEKISLTNPEVVFKLKEHGVTLSDFGVEGFGISTNIEYCAEILNELMKYCSSTNIFDKVARVGLSNSFYALLPQLKDNGEVQPVLDNINLLLKKKQMIDTLRKLK